MKKNIQILILLLCSISTFAKLSIKKEPSSNFEQRINLKNKKVKPEYIILHYTANCNESSIIQWLKSKISGVSIHYVIGPSGNITMMVDPKHKAWHAGESFWNGCEEMNTYSIGIEIINPGSTQPDTCPCKDDDALWSKNDCLMIPGSKNCWYPFTKKQIDSVIKLCKKLMTEYNIQAKNVLGHSDISPGRKTDPGPLFPWSMLAKHNIGIWPKNYTKTSKISIKKAQKYLQEIGYKINISGIMDLETEKFLTSFQIHFRPTNIDGKLDQETFSILKKLAQQVKTI